MNEEHSDGRADAVQKAVDSIPPLTDEQREAVAAILSGRRHVVS